MLLAYDLALRTIGLTSHTPKLLHLLLSLIRTIRPQAVNMADSTPIAKAPKKHGACDECRMPILPPAFTKPCSNDRYQV